eukprot:GHVH01008821.1.p1 GENE.GHVH01008821.1~~GHVH01008821.1.p1  ORF type:complete len:192 (+),score=31.13 GHVH01008821.1:229-804(+)
MTQETETNPTSSTTTTRQSRNVLVSGKADTVNKVKLNRLANCKEAENRVMTHVLGPSNRLGQPLVANPFLERDPDLTADDQLYGLSMVDVDYDQLTPFELQARKEKESIEAELESIKVAQQKVREEAEASLSWIPTNHTEISPPTGIRLPSRRVKFQCSIVPTVTIKESIKTVQAEKIANPLSHLKRKYKK